MSKHDTRNRGDTPSTLVLEQYVPQTTARAILEDQELNDIPVLNPGEWFGKTFLLEIVGSYSPLYLIVEAGSVYAAIDELADNERYGHNIIVADDYLSGSPEEGRYYGPSGQVLDLCHLAIHGAENAAIPFPCRYFGDKLPEEGVLPVELDEWDWDETPAEPQGDQP